MRRAGGTFRLQGTCCIREAFLKELGVGSRFKGSETLGIRG